MAKLKFSLVNHDFYYCFYCLERNRTKELTGLKVTVTSTRSRLAADSLK